MTKLDESVEIGASSNIEPLFRDFAKIFSRLPNHVDIEELMGEFALYFVPPEYVHLFHKKIYKIINEHKKSMLEQNKKKAKKSQKDKMSQENQANGAKKQKEQAQLNAGLKNLQEEIFKMQKKSQESQNMLLSQIDAKLNNYKMQQDTNMHQLSQKIQSSKVQQPSYQSQDVTRASQIDADELMKKVANILDSKLTQIYLTPQVNQTANTNTAAADKTTSDTAQKIETRANEAYLAFLSQCFDSADQAKNGVIPISSMDKLLTDVQIRGYKHQVLLNAFNDMCKYTDKNITKHQFLSVMSNTKDKTFDDMRLKSEQTVSQRPSLQNLASVPIPSVVELVPPPPPSNTNREPKHLKRSKTKQTDVASRSITSMRALSSVKESQNRLTNNFNEKEDNATMELAANGPTMPTVSKMKRDPTALKAMAMRKGDKFFKTNKKRFVIFHTHYFYWCNSDQAVYPLGGLNVLNPRVTVSLQGTSLKIRDSTKERIFNLGDASSAAKWHEKIQQVITNSRNKV